MSFVSPLISSISSPKESPTSGYEVGTLGLLATNIEMDLHKMHICTICKQDTSVSMQFIQLTGSGFNIISIDQGMHSTACTFCWLSDRPTDRPHRALGEFVVVCSLAENDKTNNAKQHRFAISLPHIQAKREHDQLNNSFIAVFRLMQLHSVQSAFLAHTL